MTVGTQRFYRRSAASLSMLLLIPQIRKARATGSSPTARRARTQLVMPPEKAEVSPVASVTVAVMSGSLPVTEVVSLKANHGGDDGTLVPRFSGSSAVGCDGDCLCDGGLTALPARTIILRFFAF
jgi:hypothetical protein